MGTRENWETGVFIKMLVLRVPMQSQTNTSAGFHVSDMMFECSFEPVPGKERGKKKRSHRSCSISLFCFFHCSLKSLENSCQTEKKVPRPTSFSPAFGLTEKDTVNSKKLGKEKKGREDRWMKIRETVKPFQLLWPRMQNTNVLMML